MKNSSSAVARSYGCKIVSTAGIPIPSASFNAVDRLMPAKQLAVVGVLMMTFLVGDSLAGIRKIVTGVAQGDDIAMPFHSVGIRIISSYMQVAGLLNNFRLELPEAVTTLITAQSAASGVGGAVISFNCLFPETRGAELFVTRLVVIVIVLVS